MLPVELAPLCGGGGGGGDWRSKAAFEIEMSLVTGTAPHGPRRRGERGKVCLSRFSRDMMAVQLL